MLENVDVIAGRLTLVKTVLAAMPVFQLIALLVPQWFLRKLQKIIRAFLLQKMTPQEASVQSIGSQFAHQGVLLD
jgi:hypothetical protein